MATSMSSLTDFNTNVAGHTAQTMDAIVNIHIFGNKFLSGQELRSPNIVMLVEDSLTVRRATQRSL